MDIILREAISEYLTAKTTSFAGNPIARKFRKDYPTLLRSIIQDKFRYKVVGSAGQGNWADCPWIAILDTLITNSAQSGFYPVFLFRADMTGAYLSINQGVTKVHEDYKGDTTKVLKLRAEDFRARLDLKESDNINIDLKSKSDNAQLYEAGSIIAKYYPAGNLPTSDQIIRDVLHYINLYDQLAFNDSELDEDRKTKTIIEKKQYRWHYRIERNSSVSKEVKKAKGHVCEACGFKFVSKYGDLGKEFIEAHHLIPIATLEIGKFLLDPKTDFAVLCSNCHRMIHRLEDPSDLDTLKRIIRIKESLEKK